METLILPRYISAEEFDLMFDDELDRHYDDEYYYHQWLNDEYINKQIKYKSNEKETKHELGK